MPASRARPKSFGLQSADLVLAAPQVAMHRMMRMALAGCSPSARDRREFHRMGAEKFAAFYESWFAMYEAALLSQQKFYFDAMQGFWTSWIGMRPPSASMADFCHGAAKNILECGLAPVHRRAMANIRRLQL